MRHRTLTALLAGASFALAAHKPFSIQDDVLANPQVWHQYYLPEEIMIGETQASNNCRSS